MNVHILEPFTSFAPSAFLSGSSTLLGHTAAVPRESPGGPGRHPHLRRSVVGQPMLLGRRRRSHHHPCRSPPFGHPASCSFAAAFTAVFQLVFRHGLSCPSTSSGIPPLRATTQRSPSAITTPGRVNSVATARSRIPRLSTGRRNEETEAANKRGVRVVEERRDPAKRYGTNSAASQQDVESLQRDGASCYLCQYEKADGRRRLVLSQNGGVLVN